MENSKGHTILIVDDEPDILEFLSYTVRKEGYRVFTANNGEEAVKQAQQLSPSLILMDVMMPQMDGIEACQIIRKDLQLAQPIIAFLTARAEDYAQIAGFEAGADDYIAKPVRNRVLLSRVKAILRRRNALVTPEPEKYEFENLKIDRERFVVEYDGRTLQLPRKEFELLSFLASRPGRVFSRDEILENVWGNEVLVVDRTIDVHVRKIREKLDDKFIYTVKGVGYKFES